MLTMRSWLGNFSTDEDQYLAAHLLDALIYRTDAMLDSTSQHVIEMVLPDELKRLGLYNSNSVDQFIEQLVSGDELLGIRFVAVDGSFEQTPGKSGAQLIRQFYRATKVNKKLLVRPENISKLNNGVKTLVFLDDCLGTGSQFSRFCDYYKLKQLSDKFSLIYLPFVAHSTGLRTLKTGYPFLNLAPVEKLSNENNFFSESKSSKGIWLRDGKNSISDVKKHYRSLLKSKGASGESEYCLNLSLGFYFSTPNNTLKAYFSDQGNWKGLLVR